MQKILNQFKTVSIQKQKKKACGTDGSNRKIVKAVDLTSNKSEIILNANELNSLNKKIFRLIKKEKYLYDVQITSYREMYIQTSLNNTISQPYFLIKI